MPDLGMIKKAWLNPKRQDD